MPTFFYTSDDPERQVEGELVLRGDGYSAILTVPLFPFEQIKPEPKGDLSIIHISGSPREVTADYLPRIVSFSDSEQGINGLLLDAHAELHWKNPFSHPRQRLTGYRWMISKDGTLEESVTAEITLRLNVERSIPGGDTLSTATVLNSKGERQEIMITPSENDAHLMEFKFNLPSSMDMDWWMTHVVRPVESLLKISIIRPVSPVRIAMKIPSGTAQYFEAGFTETPTKRSHLLSPRDITTTLIGKWLEVAQQLGQVHYYVSSENINIQADALLFTSALEGIHRRLIEPGDNKLKLPRGVARKLSRAIKNAVKEAYAGIDGVDPEEVAQDAAPYASMVQEPNYGERVRYFTNHYYEAYPFLFGPDVTSWIKDVKSIRNKESHLFQIQDDNLKVNLESEYAAYLTYNYSLGLLLKIIMLEQAGIDRLTLQLRVAKSRFIGYQLANLDTEKYWLEYSALEVYERWKSCLEAEKPIESGSEVDSEE